MKPKYYKSGPGDVIDFCLHHNIGFAEGNIIKYIVRAGKKGEALEDLNKAKEYLNRLIENHVAKLE